MPTSHRPADPGAERSPGRAASLAASLAVLLCCGWGQSEERPSAEARREDRKATVGLVHGQAAVGKVVTPRVTVRTRYGVLEVPFSEIVKIRMRPTLAADERQRLESLLEILGGTDERGSARLAAARSEIARFGIAAYGPLLEARDGEDDEDRRKLLDALLQEVASGVEEAHLREQDEVITERFTIRGRVELDEIRIETLTGVLAIPTRDVLHVTYREIDIRKVWKVGVQQIEQATPLDTKFEVKKNQKIKLEPSGTMTYGGQTFGPGGISNHTWNGRRMGCLQWRIGSSSPWIVLDGTFEGKAEQKGTLQFCVHLHSPDASGEFKIVLTTQTK
ncbi:MAG: hypothetical protein JXA90_00620 [Planctomycetes bacterium]|nr:hypothetical protein [Planctomycetota bacterium]